MTASSHLLHASYMRPQKSAVMVYAICLVLLIISCYGFWQWINLSAAAQLLAFDKLYYLVCISVIPLVPFVFLATVGAQRVEYNRLSVSYQARIEQLQKRLNAQEDLLRTITGSDPGTIAIFDKDDRFWFVNANAARFMGADVKDVIGKHYAKLVNNHRARKLGARLQEVRTSGRALTTLDQRSDEAGKVQFLQAHFEPVAPFGEFPGGIIVRANDVTALTVERARRENMLRQMINAMVAVVDRRDPYAAGHSARVGQLSRALAEEMVLDEKDIEVAEIAGSLMNFGKVLVPREILTRTTALTPEELQRVRDSILTSADILSLIDFPGPVVPTLRQVMERYDGQGAPQGLRGEEILVTARIVAVANACVALVSPRAHRSGMNFPEAVRYMMEDADKLYDRHVVTALANYVENRAAGLDWLGIAKPS